MGTLQRSNPKVSLIANFISHFLMTMVILALLTRLGGFQIPTNDANLRFCLLDHIRSKEFSFTGFRPVQRCSTSSSIQNLKRSFLETGLVAIVISKLGERKTLLPIH